MKPEPKQKRLIMESMNSHEEASSAETTDKLAMFVDKVQSTCDDKGTRQRRADLDIPMLKALDVLQKCGWTFDWLGPVKDKQGLYNTVWEAMAGQAYAPQGRARDKIDAAADHAADIQAGIMALRRRAVVMMEDGDDSAPYIYVVPADRTGSQLKVCVTINPDHVPAAGTGGLTVRELELAIDSKLNTGQVRSSLKRMSVQYGMNEAQRRLAADILPIIGANVTSGPILEGSIT